MSIFKYPPYQRTIPWRCDADYEMAVVSPVGIGPKGDPGDSLSFEDLTDEDKLDFGRKLIESGIQQGRKGERGDTGSSAYEIAVRLGYEGTEEEWVESLRQYPALSDPDKEEMQGWLENYFGPETVEEMVSNEINEQADNIANIVSEGIYNRVYPIGSIYMSVNSTDPSELFGGTWEQLEDTFLLAAGQNHAAGDTGGEERVTLTADESGMPAHSHSDNLVMETPALPHSVSVGQPTFTHAHAHSLPNSAVVYNANGSQYLSLSSDGGTRVSLNNASGAGLPTLGATTNNVTRVSKVSVSIGDHAAAICTKTGGVQDAEALNAIESHENMPPYISVYMWKRIA